nr:type IX secretion system plug protein domain-containing protein [uncultured Porphyromonas sp.]
MKLRPILCAALLALFPYTLSGQIGAVVTQIGDTPAKVSPRLNILQLGGRDQLHISFDLLGGEQPLLSYRVRSYDVAWRPSSLLPIEYIEGFDTHLIGAPEPSRSTLIPYAHYQLSIPNEQTGLKRSGNYRVEIYSEDEPEKTLLSIPLVIVEPSFSVQAQVTSEAWQDNKGQHQQIDLRVSAPSTQPRLDRETKVVVLQNARWDNAVILTTPYTYTGRELCYAQQYGARFPGGNSYFRLEHLSDRTAGLGVERIISLDSVYQLQLYPVTQRSQQAYQAEESHQGLQLIRMAGSSHPETEADYHEVLIRFVSPRLAGGDVVLEGEAFRYISMEQRTLHYSEAGQRYEGTVLLKMGYQEYLPLFRAYGQDRLLSQPTVGDHYQTKNRYTILVYHRSPSDRVDRLVAVSEL